MSRIDYHFMHSYSHLSVEKVLSHFKDGFFVDGEGGVRAFTTSADGEPVEYERFLALKHKKVCIGYSGTRRWMTNGKPFYAHVQGKMYFVNDRLHRTSGPAFEEMDEDHNTIQRAWIRRTGFHNIHGPALETWIPENVKYERLPSPKLFWIVNGMHLPSIENYKNNISAYVLENKARIKEIAMLGKGMGWINEQQAKAMIATEIFL